MTASSRRPLSAIYLGGLSVDSSPISLSSPSSSLVGVKLPHLPSPPHTNSASSGESNEGTNFGSVRLASTPYNESPSAGRTMLNGTAHQNASNRFTDSDYGDDNDEEEDATATLSSGSRERAPQPQPSPNRAKTLADRNREVLNKLASISSSTRLGTPSPRAARTPLPSVTTRSSLSNNSTPSSASSGTNRVAFTRTRSDSTSVEAERHNYTSDQSSTPPASVRPSPANPMPDLAGAVRERLISEPSPPRNRSSMVTARNPNNGPNAAPRSRRVTMIEPNGVDLTAASGSTSRRSPTATKRVRQPLPREFRDNRRSLDGALAPPDNTSGQRAERHSADDRASPAMYVGRGSPSPTAGASTFAQSTRQTRPRPGRASLRHDRTASIESMGDLTEPVTPSRSEGRGAAESPVKNKRFLLENLRAAGLTRRGEGDDPFGDTMARRTNRLSGGLGTRPSLADRDRDPSAEPEPQVMSPRVGVGDERLPRTPPSAAATGTPRLAVRSIQAVLAGNRPSTAAGGYDDNNAGTTGQHVLRSYRSNLNLERPLSRQYTSPPNTSHMSPMTPFMSLAGQGTSDHAKLMLDSLTMFEGHLSRLPSSAHYGTTVGDLMRSAQVIVNTSHHLNNHLRNAGARALEEQIEAEVGDKGGVVQTAQAEIWRAVGQDFREALRASDEQVRSMTGFMLGVGRLLKETAAGTHGRGISLDESRLYSNSVDPLSGRRSTDGRRSDGRQSVELRRPDAMSNSSGGTNGRQSVDLGGRRSVEPGRRSVEPGRRSVEGIIALDRRDVRRSLDTPDSMRRVGGSPDLSRPATSLSMVRDRDSRLSAQEMVDRERRPSTFASQRYMPSLSAKPTPLSTPITPASSHNALPMSDSSDSMHARPPTVSSPEAAHHRRALPPITIPPPLPTLPSESIIRRSASTRTPVTRNPKTPVASNATVRGSSILPGAASGNPTTAVSTTTVSTSVDDGPDDSAVSPPNSKPSTLSRIRGTTLSALNGLQQHTESFQRKRTISATSATDDMEASPMFKNSPLASKEPSPGPPGTLSRTSTTASARRSSLTRPTESSAARSGSSARSRTVTAATASSLARAANHSGSGSASGTTSGTVSGSERKFLRSSRARMSLDAAQTMSSSREHEDDDFTPPNSAYLASERRPRKRVGGELYS